MMFAKRWVLLDPDSCTDGLVCDVERMRLNKDGSVTVKLKGQYHQRLFVDSVKATWQRFEWPEKRSA